MITLHPKPGEFAFVVEVKRKDTGQVETYNMIGTLHQPEKDNDDVTDTQFNS